MASSGEELRPVFASDEECTAFMKGGGCSAAYEAFAECVALAACCRMGPDDERELCCEPALNLFKCMEEHADHYEPFLRTLPPGPGAGEGKEDGGEEGGIKAEEVSN